MVNSWKRARSSGPLPARAPPAVPVEANRRHPSGGVLTFVESGVADFPETLQVAAQSAHIGPGDLVGTAVEMLGTEGSEAGKDRVNFGFAGNESFEGAGIIRGITHQRLQSGAPYMLRTAP